MRIHTRVLTYAAALLLAVAAAGCRQHDHADHDHGSTSPPAAPRGG